MNSRADRLQPAIDQAKKRCADALMQMVTQQNHLDRVAGQLTELTHYRDDYAVADGGAMAISALLNQQKFVERIDRTILQQVAEVGRLRRSCEQGRHRWQQAHARVCALGTLIANCREEERQAEDRREQAESDEYTQSRRRHPVTATP